MIDQRLFDWYRIDTKKNLRLGRYCFRPFDTVLIDKSGSCYLCECTAWLPQSVGNLYKSSLEEILDSDTAKLLRGSINDGSYRYCNNQQCSYLLDHRGVSWPDTPNISDVKNIRLAIDDSCNLSCPSCRKEKIFLKRGKQLQMRFELANKIVHFLKQDKHFKIHIGSDGDPFASLVYRYFIQKTKNFKNLSYSIQTNGLLIKKMFAKNKSLFENLETLNLSIDGATKETYETLRRGGSFEKIIENLEFIRSIKKSFNFKFILHFVVQQKNYKEMLDMIGLAKKYSADKIWFNKITNWNTFENFEEQEIFNNKHPEYKNYKNCLDKISVLQKEYKNQFIEFPTLT